MGELAIPEDVALWLLPTLALLCTGGLGLAVGWVWASARHSRRATFAQDSVTELRVERATLEAQLAAQSASSEQAASTFGALADDALRRSSEQFLTLA
ncbi:MAG: hypothetical protein ACI9EF_002704, partial [Pseudohongiellaceae bacterium]